MSLEDLERGLTTMQGIELTGFPMFIITLSNGDRVRTPR